MLSLRVTLPPRRPPMPAALIYSPAQTPAKGSAQGLSACLTGAEKRGRGRKIVIKRGYRQPGPIEGSRRAPVARGMRLFFGLLERVPTQTLLQIIFVLAATLVMKAWLVFM
jgi:hypothetical protein